MSDPKSSYGEPVEEPAGVDDVVGRANEGLADAEAVRREPATPAETPADAPGDESADTVTRSDADGPVVVEETRPTPADVAADHTSATAPAATPVDEPDPWDSPEAASLDYSTPAASTTAPPTTASSTTSADDSPTVVVAPVVTPSEPVVEPVEPAAASPVAPQPIFVQAPEAPRPRGNRAAAGAIGLLAAIAFAVLYLAVWLGVDAIEGEVTGENFGTAALGALGTWSLWVPVVVFFIAFWLLGAIINRGRWGAWVVFGILVGIAAYGGHILGALFQAPFWELTASEGGELAEAELLTPLAIAAFVIGRELTIWFGAWAAARAKRVTELNVEAQREYERTLEAGPQLVRA
ncbi:ABC transporter [Microbacterium hibisci]|uniref:ABC transporter n=1 Tax=Microbacterium hibisci TaxID=2036000 RepID=UPI001940C6F2|nr:ABC transporter [Microbacterium hibisci]